MRRFLAVLVILGLVASCSGGTVGSTTSIIPTTTSTSLPTTSSSTVVTTTTTLLVTTTTEASAPIELTRDGPVVIGTRDRETLFVLTHDPGSPAFGAEITLDREPNGALSRNGFLGTVWHVREGVWDQWEIHRLWPSEPLLDVIWLTDYSGASGDTLTGHSIQPGDDFTLHDEIALELSVPGQVGLHGDCRVGDEEDVEIAAALLSFSAPVPTVLMAWVIDYQSATLVEFADLDNLSFGDCFTPQPRS